jgi:uncharacterized membrane protein (DUF4010 family)
LPIASPLVGDLAIDGAFLLGLSFFLGFAFEDIFARAGVRRPGGVRTFPMLALVGGLLYLFDPLRLIPFTVGLAFVGACLLVYYREHIKERDESGQPNVGLMVLLLNVYAYLLGPLSVAFPHWVGVGATVAATLLFTGRTRLHELARRIEIREIVIAAQFLILAGLVLPLLPSEPVTTLTTITPRQAWLALVVVCGFSYASYLIARYAARAAGGLWLAALGGLYSSTATTVVLARQMKRQPALLRRSQAGITLATSIMYVRVLAVVAVFNFALARDLAPYLLALSFLAFSVAILQYRSQTEPAPPTVGANNDHNPLELGPALAFATMFVGVSLLSNWIVSQFGSAGIYAFAAAVGVADIDPFVLNLAQGGVAGLSTNGLAGAVLVAASSNNVLKAAYAVAFAGWRSSFPSACTLAALAGAGIVAAWTLAGR